MGSCYSVDTNASNAEMKLKLPLGSKTEKVVAPSPSRSTATFTEEKGSKDEAFFDSKAWLDSDCEDDFYSVNGDFTPSRGTTPVHHSFGTPVVNKTASANRVSASQTESSPDKKKKLLELFQDSVKVDQKDGDGKMDAKPTIQDIVLPKSANSTPYISGANSTCSSERNIMSEDRASIIEKSTKSMQRCLPSLSSCRSFSERRKASPAVAVNGKH